MSAPLVVAIDGPAGTGKSTIARRLAGALGIPYLDTGAMYRALGLRVLESGVDPGDAAAVAAVAEAAVVRLRREADGGVSVLLDGEPVGERIRRPAVGEVTSRIARIPAVRAKLVALQRELAQEHGGVIEGRDIGTKVVPGTPHKFFLDARPEVRFRRRFAELRERGQSVNLADVAREMSERDRRDAGRADSPLTHDATYTVVDTSDLSVEQVVERLVAAIRSKAG
ncbi:MAG: (d)CMP kinase [Acidobacteriota bacterium]